MAKIAYIKYSPHRFILHNRRVEWLSVTDFPVIQGLPQLIWNDSKPWRQVNSWALERATGAGVSLKTVQSNLTALHSYANWLEQTQTDWQDFPLKKAHRCLVRYRGALIEARNEGRIAPSTASHRMSAVVQFYRWLHANNLLAPGTRLWTERSVPISLSDNEGFERTIRVQSTDLAIPNRSPPGERLEDGLLPVSVEVRDVLLALAKENSSDELFLMLTLGFYTGMRLGTICDLRIETLERAVHDPASPHLYRIGIGPGAHPPVHTKFGVTGHILITKAHLDGLLTYAYSVHRLKREAKATPANKNLIFLTRFGNPYARGSSDKSAAVNVEMHRLRKTARFKGVVALHSFYFHQSRCTFATELARLAIRLGGAINAISTVKTCLLHKNEATALRYIRFVERMPIKQEMGDAFTRQFLGLFQAKLGS